MSSLETALRTVIANPLSSDAHESLGDAWREAGRPIAAAACYRTADSLGDPTVLRLFKLALAEIQAGRTAPARARLSALPDGLPEAVADQVTKALELCETIPETPLEAGDHNRHLRMATLAAFLRGQGLPETMDLLDVGGGDGLLCHHLPAARYRLAEPGTNGLRGESLQFPEQSVDVVVACHVLEHVPADARFIFLDSLRHISRGHLVLLNPFAVPAGRYEERLQVILELTGAEWAKEHMECGLPELSVVKKYADTRGLKLHVEPQGSTASSFLSTMVTHYAQLAGRETELTRIHRYLNSLDPALLTNTALPTSYLVHFSW